MRFSFEAGGCFPTGRHCPGIAHLMKVVAAGLVDEFDALVPTRELTIVSIDAETTGRDFELDRIVELAFVVFERGEMKSTHSWLINPEREIPAEAIAVHGITNEDVQDKPTFSQLVPEILAALQGFVPLAYNAEFDQTFLLRELKRAGTSSGNLPPAARKGVQWLDPLTWARELYRDAKSKSLGAMCELLEVKLTQAHRATDDATAAALLFECFLKDERVPSAYGAFMQEQQRLSRVQAEERQYWRSY